MATGVGGEGGGEWYRFAHGHGLASHISDALPVHPPGFHAPFGYKVRGYRCGTGAGGWLSGWDANKGDPSPHVEEPGRYPELGEGVVEATVCFAAGLPCVRHARRV